jgi:hypothetical protein
MSHAFESHSNRPWDCRHCGLSRDTHDATLAQNAADARAMGARIAAVRPAELEAYDVLQVQRKGAWLDYSTLRTESDFTIARSAVRFGSLNGERLPFRIVRQVVGKGQVVVLPEGATSVVAAPAPAPKAPRARPSFTAACGWIAYNDSGADGDDETLIRDYLTTALVADLFGATTTEVAAKVAKLRRAAK